MALESPPLIEIYGRQLLDELYAKFLLATGNSAQAIEYCDQALTIDREKGSGVDFISYLIQLHRRDVEFHCLPNNELSTHSF